MPEVILDGPGAGMTTQEYEAKRAVDCQVGSWLGWTNFPNGRDGYVCRTPMGFMALRDEDSGMPFFSFDMNGAWVVLKHVVQVWNYLARQKFWELLQQRASMDPVTCTFPPYPDVLETLVAEMPESICDAFLETAEYHKKRGISLTAQSPRAASFADRAVKTEEFTEILEDGRKVERSKITVTKAPWVH